MKVINERTWLQKEDGSGVVPGVCCGVICSPYCKKRRRRWFEVSGHRAVAHELTPAGAAARC